MSAEPIDLEGRPRTKEPWEEGPPPGFSDDESPSGIAKPLRWSWRGADDVFGGPERKLLWTVEALGIAPGRPGILSGPSGGAKTAVAQSLVLSLVSGRQIWGHFDRSKEEKPIKCGHIDVDLGLEDLEHRYRRLRVGFPGVELELEDLRERFRLVSFPDPAIDLMRGDARSRLAGECAGLDFVFCDALRGLATGNENDSEFRRALDTLTAVSSDIKTTFLVAHHTGLSKMVNGKPVEEDDEKAGRGTSGIRDGAGVVLRISGSRSRGRKLWMAKPPGRMGVEWNGKFNFSIDDIEDTTADGRSGLRVVVRPEVKRTKDEVAELAAAEAVKRGVQIEKTLLAIVRQAGSPGFKGGIDRLVATARDALRSAGAAGVRNDEGRGLVQEMLDAEQFFVTGKGPATRITLVRPPPEPRQEDLPKDPS